MKCLVDRCAGQRVAVWLQTQGHEVLAAWDTGPDPGDAGLIRLPDVPAAERIRLLAHVLARHTEA